MKEKNKEEKVGEVEEVPMWMSNKQIMKERKKKEGNKANWKWNKERREQRRRRNLNGNGREKLKKKKERSPYMNREERKKYANKELFVCELEMNKRKNKIAKTKKEMGIEMESEGKKERIETM